MKLIKTLFFTKQIDKLRKSYSKIDLDILNFEKNLENESFFSDLGHGIYKYRLKNSSIPIGKRGGFRIILKKIGDNVIFLLIYSKTLKDNITKQELNDALEKVFQEL